jgi:hypothetical protein
VDHTEYTELRAAVHRGCGLAPAKDVPATTQSLLDELVRRVDDMLRHDPEKLMYYLYALDVSEDIVARAFDTSEPARFIAAAILDREAERLRTRKKYERDGDDGGAPLLP